MNTENYFPKNDTGKYRLFAYGGPEGGPLTDEELLFDFIEDALLYVYEYADMWALQLPNSLMYEFTEFDKEMMLSPFHDYTREDMICNGKPLKEIKKEHEKRLLQLKVNRLIQCLF